MKVKRFFAQSMAEALKQVRAQMGPDAVILSNRRVDGGVEIVTALDYDENMARQRLGDQAREATNGSKLAEMQAEQHRRLEQELGRSRDRIREVREKRANLGAGYAGAAGLLDDAALELQPEATATTASATAAQVGGSYSDELAQMRAEISSLRDLMGAQKPKVEPASPASNAVQQRLSERLQEFGLGMELANSLSRRHKGDRKSVV